MSGGRGRRSAWCPDARERRVAGRLSTARSTGWPPPVPQSGPPPLAGDELGGPPAPEGPSGTSDRGVGRYDEVGYATWYGSELAGQRTASGAPFDPRGFTAAHRTLPLGSYAEITSLQTGRTILVLVNDRGPNQAGLLIDLSQGAAQALGIDGRGAVRVRRVTPSAGDLNALRAGQPGAPRLDAPSAVLAGLRQRMSEPQPGTTLPPPRRPAPLLPQSGKPAPKPTPKPAPPVAKPAPATDGYYVQVAAFSSQARAQALAKSLDGSTVSNGTIWRVRLGPYGSQEKASQARDAARARGYGDARVVRED